MNNKVIHIIHPKDETTDFLEEITSYIIEKTNTNVNLLRLGTREEHFSFFEIVHLFKDDELILFLGHGTSSGLSGCNTNEYEQIEFITEKQLKVFENKNIVILSCRSNQYLKSYFNSCSINSAIGFPNLITDFEEIEHHDDPERFDDVSKEDIELFKKAIIEIVKFSLEDFVLKNLTISQLFNRLKLRINKRIIYLYSQNPSKGKIPLGKMLNDMEYGLNFFKIQN